MQHHPLLGNIQRDKHVNSWLTSDPVPLAYLGGTPVAVTLCEFEQDTNPQELIEALERFLAKPFKACVEAEEKVHADYLSMGECCGFEELEEIATPADVWDHAWPTRLYVHRNEGRDEQVYVSISFDCDWEQEHGLQLVFLEGDKLVRVSAIDGHLG